jgi:sulfonate transport system permease protein
MNGRRFDGSISASSRVFGASGAFTRVFSGFLPLFGVAGLVAVWSAVAWREWVDPVLLPSPAATFRSLWTGMAGRGPLPSPAELLDALVSGGIDRPMIDRIIGPLGIDFVMTVYRTAVSTLIAAVIAIPLGILLGAAERLYRSLEFVIDFFRSTPASAMFPLFVALFGAVDGIKISVAAFGAMLVILFNVAYGVMNARRTRLLAAKVMGASPLRVLYDVMLLESLPQTFVGLRNGVSLALVIIVVAEMYIGSRDGLGYSVFVAGQSLEMPRMYAAIFAAGALGYGLNLMFLMIERRFVHWTGK